MVELVCYHTCQNKGGKEFILKNAPFHSDTTKPQWLGQGYYLWTDSDHYAHQWLQGDYAIIKAKVEVDEFLFLDLVGNINSQLFFEKLILDYKVSLKEKIAHCTDKHKRKQLLEASKSLSISDVILHYRKARKFPFKVVKAQDITAKDTQQIPFLREGFEKFLYPTRQQIVVYSEAKGLIKDISWYYPN